MEKINHRFLSWVIGVVSIGVLGVVGLVLSQTMFLKAIRGFISVSHRRELSTLLEFFNLVQHENQCRNSQFYYLRQNPFIHC